MYTSITHLFTLVSIVLLDLVFLPSQYEVNAAERPLLKDYVAWLQRVCEVSPDNSVFCVGKCQDGYFFAVFSVATDKVAFCYCDLEPSMNRDESRLKILDGNGNRLTDVGRPTRSLMRLFERTIPNGTARWREVYGNIYPLKPNLTKSIRISFESKAESDANGRQFKVVFDELIEQPATGFRSENRVVIEDEKIDESAEREDDAGRKGSEGKKDSER